MVLLLLLCVCVCVCVCLCVFVCARACVCVCVCMCVACPDYAQNAAHSYHFYFWVGKRTKHVPEPGGIKEPSKGGDHRRAPLNEDKP